MTNPELILLPVLSASIRPDGRLFLTQKYLDGAAEYAKSWPGRVTTLARVTHQPIRDLDPAEVTPGHGPYNVEIRPPDGAQLAARLKGTAGVMAFLGPEEAPTLKLCNRIGVPVVFISEYAPQTERQIVDAEVSNPIVRMRRKIWLRGAERTRRRMLSKSAGLQCSGTPTYDLYRSLQSNALLFFDNRVRAADVISDEGLTHKISEIMTNRPLRLVFGGRLAAMKGVGDLPQFAKALHDLDIPFSLDIVGDGPLSSELRATIAGSPVSDHVTLTGPMDFRTGWIPYLKANADLFICPHPQGDPASTYPEVMSCGVAMAGYENEAFAGIKSHSGAGFLCPIGDPKALAQLVARLHSNRQDLAEAAVKSVTFARKHAFELTFARRMEHMIRTADLSQDGHAGTA
jgi:glycosyltransferase involved in cell wall biosynthesis